MPYKDKEAHRLYRLARTERNRRFLQKYKTNKGCVDCGYNENHAGMEFDHVKGKYKNVSNMVNYSMKKILEELAKCEVVCGTCHNIRTYNRRNMVGEVEASTL